MAKTRKLQITSSVLDIRFNSVHDREAVAFYSPRLALATLPLKNPKLPPGKNIWQKDCGRARIELQGDWERDAKGEVKFDKETDLPVAAIPYGAFPRLALVWLISEVTRTKRRKIPLGHSILDFLKTVGYTKNTHNYRNLEKQLKRLFNCQLTIHSKGPDSDPEGTFKGRYWQANRIATEHAFWWDYKEQSLFESHVILSEEFYNGIIQHGFPIDFDVIRLFHGEPFTLDVYLWLAYRMFDINKLGSPKQIPWSALFWQFGNFSSEYNFRKAFKDALRKVSQPWVGLNVTYDTKGVTLAPSALSVPVSQELDS